MTTPLKRPPEPSALGTAAPSGQDYPGSMLISGRAGWLGVVGNTVTNAEHAIRQIGYATNVFVLKNDFRGTTYRPLSFEGEPGTLRKAVIHNNVINQGLSWHLKSYQADAWCTFILTNTYKSGSTNVGMFVDPPAASHHFPN